MAHLPENVVELLNGGHVVWVATIGPDGWPNIAIKGSGALVDDQHIFFADVFSKKTRDNLQANPVCAVGIYDHDKRIAMQVKGHATLVESGKLFDNVSERIAAKQPALPPVKYVVEIVVESIWDMSAGPTAGDRLA
ncbi:MAG TPA: pyridoxamine 5'-phosphate oxidase family protein [Capsulimonadaceae bacterium]|jgi:hypothetical protein